MGAILGKHIRDFLLQHERKIGILPRRPIIEAWLDRPSMAGCIQVLDEKVAYLLGKNGGRAKCCQWFLSGDNDFNAITAERYVLDYLRSKNPDLRENLRNKGVDAQLRVNGDTIGIEVLALQCDLGEWVFCEQLPRLLLMIGCGQDRTLTITFSSQRLNVEYQNGGMEPYLEKAVRAIRTQDRELLGRLDLSISIEPGPGIIVWNAKPPDAENWFDILTRNLLNKLTAPQKANQLKRFSRNIVFVGVNQAAQVNWAIPRIFEEIGTGANCYRPQIQCIERFWCAQLAVIGLCYFVYSLDQREPFYPLRILWQGQNDAVTIAV